MANPRPRSVPVPTAPTPRPRREYWQAVVEECRQSGLSQAEFCRRRGIATGTLSFWKSVLTRRLGRGAGPAPAGRRARPAFVPVQVVASGGSGDGLGAEPPRGGGTLEIVLGGGRLVRVRERVDAQWLGEVVGVLETARC